MKIKNKQLLTIWTQACVIVSVFSQIQPLGIPKVLLYASWLSLICVLIINKPTIKKTKTFIVYVISGSLFGIYILICSLVNPLYLESNYLYVLFVPLLITTVGILSNGLDNRQKEIILNTFIAASVVYALYICIVFFPSLNTWAQETIYAFSSKNSSGQILSIAAILSLRKIKRSKPKVKILKLFIFSILIITIVLCRSRTSIIALIIASLYYGFTKSKNKLKFVSITIIIIAAIVLIPITRSVVVSAFFIDKYSGQGLNAFSSGRLSLLASALEVIKHSPIIGVGKYYIDCSYISILAETGIIGFILIESIWITRIMTNFKNNNHYIEAIRPITVFYLIESLFEGLPPFGPGVTSFMFWMISEWSNIEEEEKYELEK